MRINKAVAVALALTFSVALAFSENSDEQVFRDLENRILHAVMTKDVAEMGSLLASDYTSVGISGHIRSRAEVLQAYSSGRLVMSAAQTDKMTVRPYGDVAIVVGLITVSGKEGSTDISGQYAFTRVYKREAGKWLAVSFQATPVR